MNEFAASSDIERKEKFHSRIVILLGAPFTAQNFERTGIPYLSANFDVAVFDCLSWLGRSAEDVAHRQMHWDQYEKISSAEEFCQALKKFQPAYAIDFIGLGGVTRELQRHLADAGVQFVVQKTGALPTPGLLVRAMWRLRIRLSKRGVVKDPSSEGNVGAAPLPAIRAGRLDLVKRLLKAVYYRMSLSSPDISLLAGRKSQNFFTRRSKRLVWIASQDFHRYRQVLAEHSSGGEPRTPYILFVDDNLPYASDWKLLGLPAPVTPEVYYRALGVFFTELEKYWGMPVVIAGHPSSEFHQIVNDSFGGRTIVYGRTAQLVMDCKLVLVHGSTAASFAVLSGKPIMFMTTDELQKAPYGLHIQTMARTLTGRKALNIDRSVDAAFFAESLTEPHKKKYEKYVVDYLRTEESTETHPWQAFSEFMIANERPATR
ncbi:hypothetical protein [Herbaspirillum sp. NPDC101397]|uniref:hypothetical protein n=1 Tax=Herbaspirillum sp. NPDC101397 TaxID=3364006 RepID=UPI00383ACBCD